MSLEARKILQYRSNVGRILDQMLAPSEWACFKYSKNLKKGYGVSTLIQYCRRRFYKSQEVPDFRTCLRTPSPPPPLPINWCQLFRKSPKLRFFLNYLFVCKAYAFWKRASMWPRNRDFLSHKPVRNYSSYHNLVTLLLYSTENYPVTANGVRVWNCSQVF